mgnify:CR=1 FL=1
MSDNENRNDPRPPGFETLAIHAGASPDEKTGARNVPIYQTTAYVFDDADHAASLFNLQTFGYIYTRIGNPTVAVLEERIASLEGGRGCVCVSSGHAAQLVGICASLDVAGETASWATAIRNVYRRYPAFQRELAGHLGHMQ